LLRGAVGKKTISKEKGEGTREDGSVVAKERGRMHSKCEFKGRG